MNPLQYQLNNNVAGFERQALTNLIQISRLDQDFGEIWHCENVLWNLAAKFLFLYDATIFVIETLYGV